MPAFTPPSLTLTDKGAGDPRVGQLLGKACKRPGDARVVLLGFPSDQGVRINGGRPGAAGAPDRIREFLFRLTPDARKWSAFVDLLEHSVDLGNLSLEERLENSQELLAGAIAPYLQRGAVPVILGGGHETTFGHFLGYTRLKLPVHVLNWDAHADVRPLKEGRAHSGSPFRQAIEHPSQCCRSYTVAGLQPQSVAREHLRFIENSGGRYVWGPGLTESAIDAVYDQLGAPAMVSFDLDAVDQARAPGVSAPSTGGLEASLWLHAAYSAGRNDHVQSLDLVELNPLFDVDHRTARLAALTVWNFFSGLVERAPQTS